MALLFVSDFKNADSWVKEFHNQARDIELYVWPRGIDVEKVEFIAVWSYEDIDYNVFPNLKCISSLAAGIDHIDLKKIPQETFVTRIVDPAMRIQMSEYVVMAVCNYRRHLIEYKLQQHTKVWTKIPEIDITDLTVGIMGVGSLGMDAALKLQTLGYPVIGWSRSPKPDAEITVFSGEKGLPSFLARSKILVCFLPVTEKTKNILNYAILSQLPKDAYLVNVARGALLVDEDLISLLDSNHLFGACLDVFRKEPLPLEHPFWHHPKIIVTPHMSSNPISKNAVKQIITNYRRMKSGEELLNVVDKNKGY
ncbi:MAG: glyoxylate/hydroxypyruvate reductase A [Gammaproteobacteria bacterium]|jgi:glyoxylate/hydroxypyruvate reductase A